VSTPELAKSAKIRGFFRFQGAGAGQERAARCRACPGKSR
jgi:hypothetical protein